MAKKQKILLLSCCAPCSCAVVEKMAAEKAEFAVAFYNPNIFPEGEYFKRLEENKRVCEVYGVPLVEFAYNHDEWLEAVKGLENEPERGKRCSRCFYMRLKKAMEYAKANGFDAVASVLGVSRFKDLDQVNEAAQKASEETSFPYAEIEGRKGGMQERRNALRLELELYNQEYCGCEFSHAEF